MSRTSFISVWRSLQSRSKCPWDVWILGQQRPAMTQSRIFRELWGLDFGLRANESCLRDIRGTEELLPALKLFFFFFFAAIIKPKKDILCLLEFSVFWNIDRFSKSIWKSLPAVLQNQASQSETRVPADHRVNVSPPQAGSWSIGQSCVLVEILNVTSWTSVEKNHFVWRIKAVFGHFVIESSGSKRVKWSG